MEWWALALAWFFMTVLTAPPLIGVRRTLVVPVIFGLSLCALAAGAFLGPYWRLAAFSLWLLYAVKAVNLAIKNVHISTATHFIYMTVWPGMDPEHLNQKSPANDEEGYRFLQGLVCYLVGIGAALALALIQPVLAPAAVGLLGILAILLTFHFGVASILASVVRMSGRRAGLLFDSPLKARTLNDFWSHRWNLAFVEMNRRLVMGPLVRRFGIRKAMLGAFIVSGLLHELAISYPAGAGWGLPFLYFLIQGAGVFLERRLNLRSRGLAWAFILLPVPLLFPAPFRETFILPLFSVAHLALTSRPLVWYLGLGLWITGVLQLVVLLASYQVPKLLRWREELPRLSPFNQKLMWTYGLFIVLCIIGFGTLTLALHHPLMLGGEIAVGLLLFMATFWLARIAVDVFYFKHEDWPKGSQFIAGHALLTSLFAFLVLNYAGLAAWHLLGK